MDFDKMMAELFADEDRAREMARRLMELSKRDPKAAASERPTLLEFLRGAMERHMAHEEKTIFPLLIERGLGPEVEVAMKHHASIRKEAENLAGAQNDADIAKAIFFAARMMLHHTNFEGDYIYPELDRKQWMELMKLTAR